MTSTTIHRSGARKRLLSRSLIAAGATGALLLTAAGPSWATPVTVDLAAANNVYQTLVDIHTAMEGAASDAGAAINTLTFNSAPQTGGFWRVTLDGGGSDTTTLRGITSGDVRKQMISAAPWSAPGGACSATTTACANGPLAIDGFFSADESNADQVIPHGSGTGTCVTGNPGQGSGETITACPGNYDTEIAFTVGHLGVYSCKDNGSGSPAWGTTGADPQQAGSSPPVPVGAVNGSGNGVPGSPRCKATPVNVGSPAHQIRTIGEVVTWLGASTSNRVSIALPSSAPFGAAAKQALITAGFSYDDSSGSSAQNAFPSGTGTNQCEGTLPSGAHCQVRLEAGISQVRGAVTAGTVPVGLVATSNVKNVTWTSGTTGGPVSPLTVPSDDPNVLTDNSANTTVIPESAYTAYGKIKEFFVGTAADNTQKWTAMNAILTYITTDFDALLTFSKYGYTQP
jgi:hypothetical protein